MLSSIDWMLLGVLALSALLGALRGFVAEVLSLVVWVAAFWLAFMYGAAVADWLPVQMHDAAGRLLLAYAAVFLAAMIAGGVVTWLVGSLVRSIGLGGIDRMLGLGYGLLRGVALGCVLVLVLGFTALPRKPEWRASPLVPEYQRGAEWIRQWLPAAAAGHVNFDAVAGQGKAKAMQVLSEQAGSAWISSQQALQASPAHATARMPEVEQRRMQLPDAQTTDGAPASAASNASNVEHPVDAEPPQKRSKHHRKN